MSVAPPACRFWEGSFLMAPVVGREQGAGACRREGTEQSGQLGGVVVYLVCA